MNFHLETKISSSVENAFISAPLKCQGSGSLLFGHGRICRLIRLLRRSMGSKLLNVPPGHAFELTCFLWLISNASELRPPKPIHGTGTHYRVYGQQGHTRTTGVHCLLFCLLSQLRRISRIRRIAGYQDIRAVLVSSIRKSICVFAGN